MGLKENIKQKRLENKMTLEELATKVGVSRQTIQRYESGTICNIPSDKIELMASALNTTPASLMGWTKKEKILNTFCGNGAIDYVSNSEKALIDLYRNLNSIGKKEAYKRVEELTLINRYIKHEPELAAAHDRTDIDVTEEMKKHDDDIMNDDSEWE